jgi:hypothetical protein
MTIRNLVVFQFCFAHLVRNLAKSEKSVRSYRLNRSILVRLIPTTAFSSENCRHAEPFRFYELEKEKRAGRDFKLALKSGVVDSR